ncbi:LysR family transcriptional regulator [Pseudoduganella lutea]|uniref:LysR family transcriptional regulator n=1 Tax=Pseudoduganella lutea TaxID=321985 RepID=A0A4P6L2S0_9BURK|nr:LysR family transcriptional regulator [Pseudoduganella lutea]QBE65860.1 LysR family transcriptional regulator [Pseudoduganella lutea]
MYPASFKQLQALVQVARHQSVSRAAEAMHVTQPAVSMHLRMLEESAGLPLTRKQGRNIQMTAAGELLVGYAQKILAVWEEAGNEIAALKGVTSGTLRIGAVMTAEHLLPAMLVRFTGGHPGVHIKLRVGSRPEVIGMLSRDEIDLAIMGTPPREFPTSASRFARHPMAFFVAPTHALAGKAVAPADLIGHNLLVREPGSGTRSAIEHLYREANAPLSIGSELSSNEAIKRMTAAGLGVAFLSVHACTLEVRNRLLEVLPVPGTPVLADWHVMHKADHPIPTVAASFQEFMVEHGQQVITGELEGGPAPRDHGDGEAGEGEPAPGRAPSRRGGRP